MGCSGSQEAMSSAEWVAVPAEPAKKTLMAAEVGAVKPETKPQSAGQSKGAGRGKGKGKGRGKGKGKGKGRSFREIIKNRFQILLEGKWQDYNQEEDGVLKRAFLIGQPNTRFHLRGQDYEYNFQTFIQKNLSTQKQRKIRPPPGMKPPPVPLLPPGCVIILTVPAGAGGSIEVPDPNNPGRNLQVAVPQGARPGAKMAVPVPEKGEAVEAVVQRQQGWTSGQKVAACAAAVGALAVGGVVLGEHLSGGEVSEWAGVSAEVEAASDWIMGTATDVADWTGDAAADVADWAEGAVGDVADWAESVAEDVARWVPGAAEDVEEWVVDAAEDVADWVGDAGEDVGDFVMDLF
mmetsp:Transcript_13161/g.32878  ORF Transcript_13161/g.32878 Transcript_13161/m.32878 type:complete len:349 (+) Transcript_13161:59-1105(+)